MPRSKGSQSKHDQLVRQEAERLRKQGFDVAADVTGFPQPETIHGYRPDAIAKKPGKRIILEVETPDSVDSKRDKDQQAAFRAAANGSKKTTFRRRITE